MCYDDFRWFQCGILLTNSEGERYECYDYEEAIDEVRYNNDQLGGPWLKWEMRPVL